MKFLMLCREPRLYSCQRLKSVVEQRGDQLDILDPNRFLLKLIDGKFHSFYQQGESYDRDRPAPELVGQYDGIIPRFGTTSTEMGCNVLLHFEQQGIPVLNNAMSFRLARDKWQSLQQLVGAGIPVPTTMLVGDLCSRHSTFSHFSHPFIIKTLSGSQGVGVMLAENPSSTASLLETLKSAHIATLSQQFIAESAGEDIRAFVVGQQVVATMIRQGASGEFRANIHQGGQARAAQLSHQEKDLAIKATQALGLDVAGVDLIRSKEGLKVLEVNASPGLEMIEKVSGVDIADKMITHLLSKKIR